jgi:hypothetical protein
VFVDAMAMQMNTDDIRFDSDTFKETIPASHTRVGGCHVVGLVKHNKSPTPQHTTLVDQ